MIVTVIPAAARASVIRFPIDGRPWYYEPVLAWRVNIDDENGVIVLPVTAVQDFPAVDDIWCVELDHASRYTFPLGPGFNTLNEAIDYGLALAKRSTGNP